MLARNTTNAWTLVRATWHYVAFLVVLSFAVKHTYRWLDLRVVSLDLGGLGILFTALTLFLGFRMSEAYDRWWEARKLWGRLVNASRGLAVQALVVLRSEALSKIPSPEAGEAAARRVVRRQVAYAHALRIALRERPDRGKGDEDRWAEVDGFLSEEEAQGLAGSVNVPSQLLRHQAEDLTSILGTDEAGRILWTRFDATIAELFAVQGGCERIRNTVFPDAISFFTRASVWVYATLVPFALFEGRPFEDMVELVFAVFLSYVLLLMERLGRILKDPFEGAPNDTPMSALSRTIERDLCQMLGDRDLRPPVRPVRGVVW